MPQHPTLTEFLSAAENAAVGLLAAGVPAGRPVGRALERIRAWQLDGVVHDRGAALARLARDGAG
jgi:hypothetical protein